MHHKLKDDRHVFYVIQDRLLELVEWRDTDAEFLGDESLRHYEWTHEHYGVWGLTDKAKAFELMGKARQVAAANPTNCRGIEFRVVVRIIHQTTRPLKEPRVRKTVDEFVIQGHYSCGWEDLTTEETRREGRAQLRCYDENERGVAHRLIKRRVRIEPAQPKEAQA